MYAPEESVFMFLNMLMCSYKYFFINSILPCMYCHNLFITVCQHMIYDASSPLVTGVYTALFKVLFSFLKALNKAVNAFKLSKRILQPQHDGRPTCCLYFDRRVRSIPLLLSRFWMNI